MAWGEAALPCRTAAAVQPEGGWAVRAPKKPEAPAHGPGQAGLAPVAAHMKPERKPKAFGPTGRRTQCGGSSSGQGSLKGLPRDQGEQQDIHQPFQKTMKEVPM